MAHATLTIEDGSGVAGADSYVTLDYARAYNDIRGVKLPLNDDDAIALIIAGFDFIEAMDAQFKGNRTLDTQETSWPRRDVLVGMTTLSATTIPLQIKNAQAYLAGVAMTSDLYAVRDTRAVIEEAIGPIITKYSATQGVSGTPSMPNLTGILANLLRNAGGGAVRSVRM